MVVFLKIIYITIVLIYAASLFTIFKALRRDYNEILDQANSLADEVLKHLKKEIKLKQIILKSKLTKENYFKTLEKLEKELFN